MATLRSRCGHHILQLCFLLLLLFSSPFSQRWQIGCLLYFHTWCGLSANLECTSEMCCMWLAENMGCKNYAKNRRLHTIANNINTFESKNTLQTFIISPLNVVGLGSRYLPTMIGICLQCLGHNLALQVTVGFSKSLRSQPLISKLWIGNILTHRSELDVCNKIWPILGMM